MNSKYKIVAYRPLSVNAAVAILKPGEEIPEEYEDNILEVIEMPFTSDKDAELYSRGVAKGLEINGLSAGGVKWQWGFAPVIPKELPEIKNTIKVMPEPLKSEYTIVVNQDLDVEIYAPDMKVPEGIDAVSVFTEPSTERDIVMYARGVARGLSVGKSVTPQVVWAKPKAVKQEQFKWEAYS